MAGSYADISQGSTGSFMGSPLSGLNPTADPYYYLNALPQAGFYNYLGSKGLSGRDPTSQYAQGQYDRYFNMYQSQAAQNPDEGFFGYLQRTNPDFQQEFMGQSPQQRGDFTSGTMTPRARFTPYGG